MSIANTISEAIGAALIERKLYIVKPQHPTMGEIALEAYGHGKACDAVALLGGDLQALLTEIAARAAEQLAGAGVGLSAEEREVVLRMRLMIPAEHLTPAQRMVTDRLLDSPPAVDYLAGIRTILASDMPGEAMRKALEELVGLR